MRLSSYLFLEGIYEEAAYYAIQHIKTELHYIYDALCKDKILDKKHCGWDSWWSAIHNDDGSVSIDWERLAYLEWLLLELDD